MENESLAAIMDFARNITLNLEFRGRMYALVLREITRRKRLKIMAEKAKPPVHKMPKGVYQFGNHTLDFPNRGNNQLSPEEQEKERREILAGINGEYDKPNPDTPPQNTDNEYAKNEKTGS